MAKRVFCALCALAAFLAFASCKGVSARQSDAEEADPSTLVFSYSANPTTGYVWEAKAESDKVLTIETSEVLDETGDSVLAGSASKTYSFFVTAKAKGTETLTFTCLQPWNKTSLSARETYTVTVDENGNLSRTPVVPEGAIAIPDDRSSDGKWVAYAENGPGGVVVLRGFFIPDPGDAEANLARGTTYFGLCGISPGVYPVCCEHYDGDGNVTEKKQYMVRVTDQKDGDFFAVSFEEEHLGETK